uniref:Uncharacterized protein n=1 Tax=Clastoptera arizonana TaxID=38151 RepID=A0A1B6CRC4_9HEMI
MNIMRKLRGSGGSNAASQDDSNSNPQHTALGLMHLKKLFSEYSHPPHPLSDKERDDKLYNMLPLFCKVFGNSPISDMSEKFRDMSAFCQQVSRLMVSEIRQRASNQSTEAASCAIAQFLEIEGSEESSNGWMLLSTLNLLAVGDPGLIQVMTAVSLPSTLVKCLYLFFDLPEMVESDTTHNESEFTPKERRILLQKIFVQVLVRLCSHSSPAEELSKKDDLTLLFSAITSWCPPYNVIWRKSAAEVLMTISRHGLSHLVVSYIHNKGCMALCLENMHRGQDLSPLEIVEMFVAVFCFLKDSSEVSQTLLEDFRSCQGYGFLSDFLLKLEHDTSPEAVEAVRNLVLMIASLSMCGYTEIRPNPGSMGTLFQIMGFTMPQPSGRGASVRNIQAFQVLQNLFLKSASPGLCCTILDAISTVYHSDNANYFILENQNTLPQFAEKIYLKTPEIQEKFFQLLEFIVFQLNFVPCKELMSLSILLRSNHSVNSSLICMQTLHNIVKHNSVFKDVYREVGILEVFVTCLQRYENLLKDKQYAQDSGEEFELKMEDEKLGTLVMNCLTVLLSSNSNNANVLRECGGTKCIHNLVQYMDCRHQALGMVRELILSTGGEDDMGTLLGMIQSASPSSLTLKSHILKALLTCLRESHRTRTVFRKVGGFVYVMSILVSMEGCLKGDSLSPLWSNIPISQILGLLHMVFNTITVAMRFEPANAKFFHLEICSASLCDTLRLLGCFSPITVLDDGEEESVSKKEESTFQNLFSGNVLEASIPENIPLQLSYCCLVLRLLYDVALDAYDKPNQTNFVTLKSPQKKKDIEKKTPMETTSGKRVSSLNLTPPAPDPVVVHAGVVIAILQLLPSIQHVEEVQLSLTLQLYIAEVIKSLVRNERNQQVMCEAGLPTQLLAVAQTALEEETHPLHSPLQYILERLATQNLEPKDLRDFLRLGNPLCCIPMDSLLNVPLHHVGGPVPLTRVKTLVSMTTPRSHGNSPLPPFVEFDMVAEGFGCLYLPSIAPQSPTGPSVVNVTTLSTLDANVVGGIGSGDRIFPPQTGLSYSTWICIERFSDPRNDPHCVRLLTLVRNLHSARDDHLICLAIVLSARDKAVIITTQEIPLINTSADWEPDGLGDFCARFWCPELLQEGQWHHLVIVLNRAVLKNSSFSIYVDGQRISTQKLHYISQNPGGGAANLTVASSVYGFVGTPPTWRRYSKLCWKQGPCHLLEEVLSPHTVSAIYKLGPHYLGSLQATQLNGFPALVAEEKIIFGLNAKAITHLTLAKIRKVYSRVDNKSIAKQLGMSSHENATPIRVLHNSAGHLNGPARSLGGVVVGYLGVRVFTPRPVSKMLENVGGFSVLLGLIAMAQDIESLYAGVKTLVCVIKGNRCVQQEMDRRRGYQTLAMLLRKKKSLLNSHILHLAFSLVGTVDSGRESSSIPHPASFQDLLCDFEVWHEAPGELQRSLLEHMYELVAESSEKRNNLRTVKDMQLMQRLLRILPDITSQHTRQVLLALLGALLAGQPSPQDLLSFGQFITATITNSSTNEKCILLQESPTSRTSSIDNPSNIDWKIDSVSCILIRNRCLQLFHGLLFTPRNSVNIAFCEEVAQVLGMDWPLLFLQSHLHSTTVVWGLRILVVLGSIPSLLQKFREGVSNGGWLQDTELVLHNKMGVVLGYQIGTAVPKSRDVKQEALNIPGFQHLTFLLTQQIDIPQIYFLLTSLMMGQPVKLLPADLKFDLDNVWIFMFGMPASQSVTAMTGRITLCSQAVTVLLAMVRTLLNQESKSLENLPESLRDYPVTIIQFIFFLYHNLTDLMPVIMSGEVLSALAATLFPKPSDPSQSSSPTDEASQPVNILYKDFSKDNVLYNHPARKFIMDFLRVMVVDSLSLPVSAKCTPVLDLILDASPENSTISHQTRYQTEVLSTLMEHLLAADILIGEQAALPVVAGGNASNIAPNVCYMAARTVDKMWQGMLLINPHEVFDFVLKLIGQAKRRPGSFQLEGLYHCLNRTILFLLSRGAESIADQVPILETLHKITNHRGLVFGAGNHELEFIGCITYCLLQLVSDQRIMLECNTKTTWHVNPSEDSVELMATQGHNLMAVAARRVWDELYVCKKPAIEEVFKMSLPNSKAPDLLTVREIIYESANKLWLNYIDSERKSLFRNPWEMHNQIQSKIQKVTGGITRLASRNKVKKRRNYSSTCFNITC